MFNQIENKVRMSNSTSVVNIDMSPTSLAQQYAAPTGRLYVKFDRQTSYDEYLAFRAEMKARNIKVQAFGRGKRQGRVVTLAGEGGLDLRPSDPSTEFILVTLKPSK